MIKKKAVIIPKICLAILTTLVISGCLKESLSEPSNIRYAVQWRGYISVKNDENITLHLAFIDKYVNGVPNQQKVFKKPLIITDRQKIPASEVHIMFGKIIEDYQLFTLRIVLPPLPSGKYTAYGLRYTDENKQEQQLSIGKFLIDVIDKTDNNALSLEGGTISSSSLQTIRSIIKNTSQYPVNINHITSEIPSINLVTTYELEGHSDSVLLPSESKTITTYFHLENQKYQYTFVIVRPMLEYTIGGNVYREPLQLTVISPEFAEAHSIKRYVEQIPKSGYHLLP